MSYPRYAEILKWTALSLFSYVAVVFVADVPWGTALRSLFIPSVDLTRAYAMAVVAILGTTISPYLFFWQAGKEWKLRRNAVITPSRFVCRRRARALSLPGSVSIRLPAWLSVPWSHWR